MSEVSEKCPPNGSTQSPIPVRGGPETEESGAAARETGHTSDLQTVINAWPALSPAVKASIVAMATAG